MTDISNVTDQLGGLSVGGEGNTPGSGMTTLSTLRLELVPFFGNASENVAAWLKLAEFHFSAEGYTDAQKVSTTLKALRKEAQSYVVNWLSRQEIASVTWAGLKNKLEERFRTTVARQQAFDKLQTIPFKGNVMGYIGEFRTLLYQLQDDDITFWSARQSFLAPLPKDYIQYCAQSGAKDMEEIFAKASEYHTIQSTVATTVRKYNTKDARTTALLSAATVAARASRPHASHDTPMDLDNISATARNHSAQPREQRTCYNCGTLVILLGTAESHAAIPQLVRTLPPWDLEASTLSPRPRTATTSLIGTLILKESEK